MTAQSLAQAENLFDFFHAQVEEAVATRGVPVSDEGVYYLSNLLVERGRVKNPDQQGPETLAELHMRASKGGVVALRSYRELGDQALYTSGFFRSSLDRKAVSLRYYMEMGAAAYGRLGRMLERPGGVMVGGSSHKTLDAIFSELAHCFAECSEALREVRLALRAQSQDESDQGVLALYEEWLRTRSPTVAARLGELGVTPMAPGGSGELC